MEDAMLDKDFPVPDYVTGSGFAIHLVRSHFNQIAIGACDSALTDFEQEWEAEHIARFGETSSPCPITFNNGWHTRFDGNTLYRQGPTILVALYADCARTERHDYDGFDGLGATIYHPIRQRLFALVVHYSRGQRTSYYLNCHKSMTSARYDGLNLVVEANQHVARQKQNVRWEDGQWQGHPKTHIPGVARQVLHRTIDEVEALFGQGKEFFQPKKYPRRKR